MFEEEAVINNLKINYKVFGAGPSATGKALLILHGWGSDSNKWQKISQAISEIGIKVIVPDMPGFGKSEVPKIPWTFNNYVNFVEEFTKTQPELKGNYYLLGHSFGGAVAVKVAVDTPQQINKLFLIACACIRKKTLLKEISAKFSKIVKIFSFLPYYLFLRKTFYKFIIRKSDYIYTKGIMKETYLRVISENLACYLSFIRTSTIIIWGDKDEFTPVGNAYLINKKIKDSKLIVIPGAGHNLNKDNQEILIKEIEDNLDDT